MEKQEGGERGDGEECQTETGKINTNVVSSWVYHAVISGRNTKLMGRKKKRREKKLRRFETFGKLQLTSATV